MACGMYLNLFVSLMLLLFHQYYERRSWRGRQFTTDFFLVVAVGVVGRDEGTLHTMEKMNKTLTESVDKLMERNQSRWGKSRCTGQ